jgi:hypothetical protein
MPTAPQLYSAKQLIEMIQDGEIALPEFQRPFRWKPQDIAQLICTAAREWPAGTFLTMRVDPNDPPFAIRGIKGGPAPTSPKLLMLDGQQRTTALYHAMTGQGNATYYIDLNGLIAGEPFEDDDIMHLTHSRFSKRYPNTEAQAAAGIIRVEDVIDDGDFFTWCKYRDQQEFDRLQEIRQHDLSGLRSGAYSITVDVLPPEVELAAIARMFETLNRTGMKLSTFDLMVARLWPVGLKLRDEWENARSNSALQMLDEEKDGIEVLRLVAMIEHQRQKNSGKKPLTIKGITQRDVLALKPETVKELWPQAVKGLTAAVEFVNERGAIRRNLVPQLTMLIPLAYALSKRSREGFQDDLSRWFWASTFAESFHGGTNPQAVKDAAALDAWASDPTVVPPVIEDFEFKENVLLEDRPTHEMLVNGIQCLAVQSGARDWLTNEKFSDLKVTDPLEIHHTVPEKFLEHHHPGREQTIANLSLLTKGSNATLRDTALAHVYPRSDVYQPAMDDQCLVSEYGKKVSESPKSIEAFWTARAKALTKLIESAVAKG